MIGLLCFIEGCGSTDEYACMKGLAINLAIIFGTRITVGNLIQLGGVDSNYFIR